MIKQITFEISNRFAVLRAAVEKKKRSGRGVLPKDREHSTLIIVREMEETVPGDEAEKRPLKGDPLHVPDKPLVSRKPVTTERYQGLGWVEARHVEPTLDQILRYRYPASATKVENRSGCR